jgi:predicted DNA-binding protein YlxM (UPF0122 family)
MLHPETANISHKIDLALAIEYRYKNNLSYQAIADKFGVCKQAVQQRLTNIVKLLGDNEENEAYDRNRSQFLTGIERQLVKQLIDRKKIKKASLGNIAYAMDKVNNIIRLEKGLSTGNQQIKVEIVQFGMEDKQSLGVSLGVSDNKLIEQSK